MKWAAVLHIIVRIFCVHLFPLPVNAPKCSADQLDLEACPHILYGARIRWLDETQMLVTPWLIWNLGLISNTQLVKALKQPCNVVFLLHIRGFLTVAALYQHRCRNVPWTWCPLLSVCQCRAECITLNASPDIVTSHSRGMSTSMGSWSWNILNNTTDTVQTSQDHRGHRL